MVRTLKGTHMRTIRLTKDQFDFLTDLIDIAVDDFDERAKYGGQYTESDVDLFHSKVKEIDRAMSNWSTT